MPATSPPDNHTNNQTDNHTNSVQITPKYNLMTALAMLVGIVIGSGIFFKADNVLQHTGGSVSLGIVVFILAAIAIIFGSLTIAQLASRSDNHGGIIAYADEFVGPEFSTMVGWFQTFLYFPTIGVVVSWVVGIFLSLLLGIDNASLELQMAIGLAWLIINYMMNVFSASWAGRFQILSTVIKLIPLFCIGILAFIKGNTTTVFHTAQQVVANDDVMTSVSTLAWLGAVGPIAFTFDGWIVATSISGELKNAKRNLPIALIVAPILILLGYLIYFVGISAYLGAGQLMSMGDASVDVVTQALFGATAGKVFLAFVIISVMGTVNGLVLGFIRLPYSLALTGRIPLAKSLSVVSAKTQLPNNSAWFTLAIALFWFMTHYITMKTGILGNMDISEIAIVVGYVLYVVLYFAVIKLWRQGVIKSLFFGLIAPILATLGSVFVVFGGLQNPMFLPVCVPICALVLGVAYVYGKQASKQAKVNEPT